MKQNTIAAVTHLAPYLDAGARGRNHIVKRIAINIPRPTRIIRRLVVKLMRTYAKAVAHQARPVAPRPIWKEFLVLNPACPKSMSIGP